MVANLTRDLVYAIRALARAPWMSALLLLILGLGTGVNASVFSLMDALLFRAPDGVTQPSRLASIYTTELGGYPYGHSSYPDFVSLQGAAPAFESLAAVDDSQTAAVRLNGALLTVRVASVSDGFLPMLGLQPSRGSLQLSSEASASPPPAVISSAFWEKAFRRTNDVVGKTIEINEQLYVVDGVAAEGFDGLQQGRPCDVWIPLAGLSASSERGRRRLAIVGRLGRGVRLGDAERQVAAAAVKLAEEHPATNRGIAGRPTDPRTMTVLRYSRLDPNVRSRTTLIATVLFGATGLVLLCACASAGGLLLSRASSRALEMGVRMALGATRRRLLQQLVIETFVAAIGGGLVGLLFANWTSGAFPSFFAPEQAALLDPRLDLRAFLFTFGLACAAGVLFGAAPTLMATRPAVIAALRSDPVGGSGGSGVRLRNVLVTAQIALSIVLLVSTVQLVRGFSSALSTESGAAAHQIAFASLRLPGRYGDELRSIRYQTDTREFASKVPTVEAVAWGSALPLANNNWREFRIDDDSGLSEYAELPISMVSNDYFSTMKIPVVAGRIFDQRDGIRTPSVTVVNDVLAARYFGRPELAVGRYLGDAKGIDSEIIGVVASDWYRTLQPPPQPTAYYSATQYYVAGTSLLVRTSASPSRILDRLTALLPVADDKVEVLHVATLDTHLSEALAMERLTTVLVASCGVLALALAVVGVYGVMADAVLRRTRELGVRMALGARPLTIVGMILTQAMRLAGFGVALGLVLGIGAAGALRARIQEIALLDPGTGVAIALLIALMVLLATIIPIVRALRISPTIALRHE